MERKEAVEQVLAEINGGIEHFKGTANESFFKDQLNDIDMLVEKVCIQMYNNMTENGNPGWSRKDIANGELPNKGWHAFKIKELLDNR